MESNLRNEKRRRCPVTLPDAEFRKVLVITVLLILPYFSMASEMDNEKVIKVGFEGNSSVYRWANGYREMMIPTFNTSREARRSVVSGGLFSIVSFDNVPCNSDSQEVGTCYSNRECKNLGGTSSGICAASYGTCCVVHVTCGGTITTNNTYFVNPDYPNPTSGPLSCSVTVNNLSGATQLYLEMLDFDIRGPTSGACLNDTFTVTTGSSTMSLPVLCGNNTGQMLYVPLNLGKGRAIIGPTSKPTGSTTLTFNLANGDDPRTWKIRVVQFKPHDFCAAPAGCTQWYRDPVGTFESFNFDGGMGELINNFCINACFLVNNPPNCGVILTEGTFMMPGVSPDCTEGYFLMIGGQKFCGDTLNNGMIVVNQTMGHFGQVQVCSGMSNPDMDLGFSLNYAPFPCTMTLG